MIQFSFLIIVVTVYLSVSFGRWLYDAMSSRYSAFRRLESDPTVCVVATAIIFLIIFLGAFSPILFDSTIFLLEKIHYCIAMFFSMGFLTPLSILPWLRRRRARNA